MAQLLPPVCTDTLKNLQSPARVLCPRSSFPSLGKNRGINFSIGGGGRRMKGVGRARVAAEESSTSFEDAADDYYAVLGLLPDATQDEIKKAYYNCMKSCHPDVCGDDPQTMNFCTFVNEVYAVLSDPAQRRVYDEIHGYSSTATNPFFDDSTPRDHLFVDEFSCIGCKKCAMVCPDVFEIEEDFGRARACKQIGKSDSVQAAIECCPVDCIHWTSAAQLSLLEDEMRRVERVNVALMLAGMGPTSVDVFRKASSRWEKRQSKVLAQSKRRMTTQKASDETQSLWGNLWGKANDYLSTEDEDVKERSARAAAAARRWREYSRKGADKPPTYKLPQTASNKEP